MISDLIVDRIHTAHVSGWSVVAFVSAAIWFAFLHWRFATGWQMRHGRLAPRPQTFLLVVSFGYAALPSAIACTAASILLAAGRAGLPPEGTVRFAFFGVAVVFFAASGWSIKEFVRPSDRRTPNWLRR